MRDDIDINRQEPPSQGPVKSRPKGDGSRTRHAFTLSVIAALALAAFIFHNRLGQSTQDANARLNISVRPASEVYSKAEQIETPILRLRALRNFEAAYPQSEAAGPAREEILALTNKEHSAWIAVSELFYDVTRSDDDKREKLEAFETEWTGGSYDEEVLIMKGQLAEAAPKNRKMNEATGTVPGLAGSDIKLPRRKASRVQSAAISDDALAGDLPMAKTYPIPMAETMRVPENIIIDASVKKDRQPRYPSRARNRGIEADVTLSMDIGTDGKVIDARIIKAASGRYSSDFGKAALRAAKGTTFIPKTINGEPAPTNGFTRIYKFRLKD